ncbi:MAG: hypothetical protein FE035_01890, partial [Thermoplasmata archaeon]
MPKKIAICPTCHTKITVEGSPGDKIVVTCPTCGRKGTVTFSTDFEELDFYSVNEPFAYVKILKDLKTLDKYYKLLEPPLSKNEAENLRFIYDTLLHTLAVSLGEVEKSEVGNFLRKEIEKIIADYEINIDEQSKKKILYYIERDTVGYGKIDALMRDPHIE